MASITHQFPGVTREALLKRNLRRHAQIPVTIVLLAALISLISIPYLYLDAKANNMAIDIVDLSFERARLRRTISELELKLSMVQSMDSVVKGAEAIGLQQSDEVRVLHVDLNQDEPEYGSALGVFANGLGRLRDSLLVDNQETGAGR
jgi:hypothetical protein